MPKRKFIVNSIVVVSIAIVTYGAFRLFAHFDCWEIGVYSPTELVKTMDYIALARWQRTECIAELEMKPGDGFQYWFVVEDVYATDTYIKGQVDSVAVWSMAVSGCDSTSSYDNRPILEYGIQIEYDSSLLSEVADFECLTSRRKVAEALIASPTIRQALASRYGRLKVIAAPDAGTLCFAFDAGEICYYDENGSPRSVSSRKYLKQVRSIAGKMDREL